MQQEDLLIKKNGKREILKNDRKPKPTTSIWQIRSDNMTHEIQTMEIPSTGLKGSQIRYHSILFTTVCQLLEVDIQTNQKIPAKSSC